MRFVFAVFVQVLFIPAALGADWPLLPSDHSVVARYDEPNRLVAIGDIHADDRAFELILKQMAIVDGHLDWAAGDTMLVVMGDILDRGPNSRRCLDILMRLQWQASVAGGRVVVLNGNHEEIVAAGDYRYFARDDAKNYQDFAPGLAPETAVQRAFSGGSGYARWIANNPAVIQVGKTLFIHAGIEEWIEKISLDDLNTTVRGWFLYLQGNGPRPPPETRWVMSYSGPMSTRLLAHGAIPPDEYSRWLQKLGVREMVVGHTEPLSMKPEYHPKYGRQLLMVDTGITFFHRGNPSAIERRKGGEFTLRTFSRMSPVSLTAIDGTEIPPWTKEVHGLTMEPLFAPAHAHEECKYILSNFMPWLN